jgi:hypothetical protein
MRLTDVADPTVPSEPMERLDYIAQRMLASRSEQDASPARCCST